MRVKHLNRIAVALAAGFLALLPGRAAPTFDAQTDVVVVGAGGSGLCAALTAAQGGAKVVVLEKNPFPGGTSNVAEGIFGAETDMQREQLILNSKDEVFRIEMWESNHWQGNAPLLRAYIEESDRTFRWLRQQGVVFETTGTTAAEARGLRTWHLIQGRGHGLVKALFDKLKANPNVTVMMQTPGQELITEGRQVVGVVAKDKSGKAIRIKGRAVIIATGGYAEDREMVAKYCDGDAGAGAAVPFNKTGDGIKMAMAVGATVEGMSHMHWFSAAPPRTTPLPVSCAGWQPTNIIVNKRGQRFCNEEIMRSFSLGGNAIRRQGFGWSVFDESMKQHLIKDGPDWGIGVLVQHAVPLPKLDEDFQRALKGGSLVEADTVEELAKKMNVPVAAFKKTVEDFHHSVDTNYDPEYLKPRELLRKLSGKLYAVKLEPHYLTSLGGVTVTPRLQAVDKNWDVIPGLYVVGQDAIGGLFGDTYPLDVPGTTYGFAVNSGRLAAMDILKSMGK